jgi:hypothetical protein
MKLLITINRKSQTFPNSALHFGYSSTYSLLTLLGIIRIASSKSLYAKGTSNLT